VRLDKVMNDPSMRVRPGRRIDERVVKLMKCLRIKHNIEEIAKLVGCSKASVSRHTKVRDIPKVTLTDQYRIVALATGPEAWPPIALAAKFNRTPETICHILKKHGVDWKKPYRDPAQYDRVRRLYQEGVGTVAIVRITGIPRRTVNTYIADLPKHPNEKFTNKLTEADWPTIVDMVESGLSFRVVGSWYGVAHVTVADHYRQAKGETEEGPAPKLTRADWPTIVDMMESGLTYREVASWYGCDFSTVGRHYRAAKGDRLIG